MYPTLPFGPLALPTGPVLAIFAVILTLDIAGRYGRRMGIHPDDLWNVGLIALTAGLIVARLWNVFQFWYIYQSEPLLILSIRPSGFDFWPGVIAAVIAGYVYLWRRALDPGRVLTALAVGIVAGSTIHSISGFATGALLGTLTNAPTALPYFDELRHPVGLYRSVASLLVLLYLWFGSNPQHPARTLWQTILGYSLIILITDGFLADSAQINGVRVSQLVAFVVALVATFQLARTNHQAMRPAAALTIPPAASPPSPEPEPLPQTVTPQESLPQESLPQASTPQTTMKQEETP